MLTIAKGTESRCQKSVGQSGISPMVHSAIAIGTFGYHASHLTARAER